MIDIRITESQNSVPLHENNKTYKSYRIEMGSELKRLKKNLNIQEFQKE